jgi:EAL domain-containing protein (putative c-di-GMP-specific phosphodiesterase class I)
VLLRWQHPTRGLISPLKFIPIAEETGLICEIGLWVMRQACAQLALWNRGREAHERISMSINVSGRQLQDPTFVRAVKSVLEETQVEPSTVEIEITESVMLQDFEQSLSVLGGLRELGVRIAIDDFGTGYSSMSYLSRLPIDKLKIDRSFINALTEDHGEHIVRAIIAMAKNLKLTVTSEGIENRIQQRLLQVLGCELGQGFLYARPMPAADVDALLRLEGPISRRNRAA